MGDVLFYESEFLISILFFNIDSLFIVFKKKNKKIFLNPTVGKFIIPFLYTGNASLDLCLSVGLKMFL